LNLQQDHQRGQELDRQVVQFFEALSSEEDLSGSLGKEFFRALVIAANRQVRLKQYESAKKIYQEALQILEMAELDMKQRRLWQATACHQLGRVAQEQRKWQEAEKLLIQSLSIFQEYDDNHSSSIALGTLARLWQATSHDASILQRVASVLEVSQEEVEKLLQEFLKTSSQELEEG
jgi:tetratricopeptide (TPR) repeat protein